MIKNIYLVILLSSAAFLGGCGSSTAPSESSVGAINPAQTYYETLVDDAKPAYDAYNTYTAFSQEIELIELDAIKDKRHETIKILHGVLSGVNAYDGYEGNTTLKEALVTDMQTLIVLLEKDEEKLFKVWETMNRFGRGRVDENAMEQLTTRQDTIYNDINQKIEASDNRLQQVKQDFFLEFDIDTPTS